MTPDDDRSRAKPLSTDTGQRLFALFLLAFLACMVWLALTGQYDNEVNRFAAWLHRGYMALMRQF